jgi:hypothetical protein
VSIEPARIGHDPMDLFDHALGENAETVVPAINAVGRQRLFAPSAQRALRRVPGFSRDRKTRHAGKPGARIRQTRPGPLVRRNDVYSHRGWRVGV